MCHRLLITVIHPQPLAAALIAGCGAKVVRAGVRKGSGREGGRSGEGGQTVATVYFHLSSLVCLPLLSPPLPLRSLARGTRMLAVQNESLSIRPRNYAMAVSRQPSAIIMRAKRQTEIEIEDFSIPFPPFVRDGLSLTFSAVFILRHCQT